MLTSTRARAPVATLADVAKDKLLTVRVSEDDMARLKQLADHYALNVSAVIRMLAKRAVDEIESKKAKR